MHDGNEPFLLTHGKKTTKAVLLIHGFCGSPWEMKELGELLFSQGHNVYGVRLAGHGTKPEDLLKTTRQDWYQSAEEGLSKIRELGEKIFIAGVSMGGMLALLLSANHPTIEGLVVLSPAVFLKDKKVRWTKALRFFYKFYMKEVIPDFKPYYYEKRAISAVYELQRLIRQVKELLPKIKIPILIFQSRSDETVNPEGAPFIYDQIGSSNKKIIWLDNSPHKLTTSQNPSKKETFQKISEFIGGFA